MITVEIPVFKNPQAHDEYVQTKQVEQGTFIGNAQIQPSINLGPAPEQSLVDLNSDTSPTEIEDVMLDELELLQPHSTAAEPRQLKEFPIRTFPPWINNLRISYPGEFFL